MNICGIRSVTACSHDAVTAETLAATADAFSCSFGEARAVARFHPSLMPAKPTIAPEVPRPGKMSLYLDAESFTAAAAGLSARASRPPRHIR